MSSDDGSAEDLSLKAATMAVREQDRFLPIANITRIMNKALPANAKIAKDAKETVQECVSEFISFITSEASDRCQQEKRKTINGEDILWAMQTLGFDNYVEPLKIYLLRYRERTPTKGYGKKEVIDPSYSADMVHGYPGFLGQGFTSLQMTQIPSDLQMEPQAQPDPNYGEAEPSDPHRVLSLNSSN